MKPAPLPPGAAAGSLVARLSRPGGLVDRVRQKATELGARPSRVFLTWTAFSGPSRGKGDERVLARHELLPAPRVDFGSLARNPTLVGVFPVGSARVDEVPPHYSRDELEGRVLPGGKPLPTDEGKVDFFYEVVPDDRQQDKPAHTRFRLNNVPSFEAENAQWVLILEPASGELRRDGRPERPGQR